MSVLDSYKNFVQVHQRLPRSLEDIVGSPTTLNSLREIETEIWKRYAEHTLQYCVEDTAFEEYIAREKMLAYVFTLIQNINSDETLIELQFPRAYNWLNQKILENFKQEYLSFVKILIEEGQDRGEIHKRIYLNRIYPTLFWITLVSILSFWSKDTSQNKEQTDVAVEKWVNLLFDTLAPNAIDSAVDLIQFLIKQNFNDNTK